MFRATKNWAAAKVGAEGKDAGKALEPRPKKEPSDGED